MQLTLFQIHYDLAQATNEANTHRATQQTNKR